ncbi:MAG: helix-turn-helix transcriptional regulator [Saprospiraceae bacterium]|nr:helix-turn-helix transcriptional regulator [Saprospiraceae bacterium]MCF8249962.1 helix-turn-helix transcriptional regulator [Saprospiraceae bacterium]MCF8278998.1 helix-turn-helix transcriptional regulator [Bacteroidales bacterium]MCF8310975.1 helix-turn-helix transcriptional regulator [Saprospiraceae bacterium]MCF8439689.1 helix-turn-helix transcriptional regulator [Saprospiraceae bacterium]
MKQYSPAFQPNPFSSRHEKKAPFFDAQPFFRNAKPDARESIQLKWFAPDSKNVFLLAMKGIDAQMAREIVLLIKSKARLNPKETEADSLDEMMTVVTEFMEGDTCSLPDFVSIGEEPTGISKPAEQPALLETIDEKIEENLSNEKFRGSDLAKLLCCCEMQLYRKIKQLSNLSPANYIRRYRLRRSLGSLELTDLPISQICFNVGFRSLEYFSRSFKKEFGVCPSAFRAGQNV